jgi:hypothetical protein
MAVIMIAEPPGADARFHRRDAPGRRGGHAGAGAWVREPHQRRREQRVSHRGVGVPGGPPGLVRRPGRPEPTARHGPIPFESSRCCSPYRRADRITGPLDRNPRNH